MIAYCVGLVKLSLKTYVCKLKPDQKLGFSFMKVWKSKKLPLPL